MTESPSPVAVGTDGSPGADRAVRWAADEAARLRRPLVIVCVVEDRPSKGPASFVPGWSQKVAKHALAVLTRSRAIALDDHPDLAVEDRLVHGQSAHAGLRTHARDACELVVGHRGRSGAAGQLLGSTGLHLAGRVPVPVVIVRGEKDVPAREVVAGLDLVEAPESVLRYAFAAAGERRLPLRVIHAWRLTPLAAEIDIDFKGAETALRDHLVAALGPWRERHPDVPAIEEVVRGHPADALVAASADADLVVVGQRAHAGPHLGSVSHHVVHHAHCPVAVVRPSFAKARRS